MKPPRKDRWKATASSGDPRLAIDDRYATTWKSKPARKPWLKIDLGKAATLAGLEVYWGRDAPVAYGFKSSLDGKRWTHLCRTRHGEGGQDVFAFPPIKARFVRWTCDDPQAERGKEIVEINLYGSADAASAMEKGRVAALGYAPVKLPNGDSITVDFGYVRYPLGAFIEWGATYGTDFSVYLSDDGESFREVGRILTGNGCSDSFWWRSTTSRYFRLTVHETSAPEGAIVNELKLRILNKDRMPIGQLERAAAAGRGDLYPQSLLGRQVYWTVLGEYDHAGEALFDEFGNLEPRRGSPQITPLVRLGRALHGAPASASISQSLAGGSLPIPTVEWTAGGVEIRSTALAHSGLAVAEHRVTNRSAAARKGALVLAVRPVQVDPYWQHGGHAAINSIAVKGGEVSVNDGRYAVFSREPDTFAVAEFENGDVVRLIEKGPRKTKRRLRSDSGLLSAACEFSFSLKPGASLAVVVSSPTRDGVEPQAEATFDALSDTVEQDWRAKIGPRKITVGDKEVSDTVEAQTAFILVNSTEFAFKPGPRNYDRTWVRDGSAQALALLWAGLVEEAKAYVVWYAQRIYKDGMVPPILNVDGTVNRGYGSDIEFDAQGEFVGIAADVYRISRDRTFLGAIFEPVVRATRFIDELCARTDAEHGSGTRFYGLLTPSISHEGYSKPSYSYFDDYFALSAWRNCEFLAREIGDKTVAAHAKAKGREFAANLTRSIRMTAKRMKTGVIPGSADRDDVDPTATSIAFEPCRVEDALPPELVEATYDRAAARMRTISSPDFKSNYSPYDLRNLNAFVALGRRDDALRLLSVMLACRRPPGWRGWAEVVWADMRAPEYIGDMPHTWIGAEFSCAIRLMLLRENGPTLELFRAVPDGWWAGEGIALNDLPTAFGVANLRARRERRRATIEFSLAGTAPERILVCYPGAKHAWADGRACDINADVITTKNWSRLEIDF
jgi:F5/8 type C domain